MREATPAGILHAPPFSARGPLDAGPQLSVDCQILHRDIAQLLEPGFDHPVPAAVGRLVRAHVLFSSLKRLDIPSSPANPTFKVEQRNKARGYWTSCTFSKWNIGLVVPL